MKNSILLFLLIVVCNSLHCQKEALKKVVPLSFDIVETPLSDKILTTQIKIRKANFVKEMEEIRKHSKFFEDTKNALLTVKSEISQGKKAIKAVSKSIALYDLITVSVQELKNSNYPSRIKQRPLMILGDILDDVEITSEEIHTVLSNKLLRMTDADRMEIIDKVNTRLDDIQYKILNAMQSAHKYGRLYRAYSKL